MNKNRHAVIVTLGCKVNQYESEALAEKLQGEGFDVYFADEENPAGKVCSDGDVCIINTCSVTAEADRKSRQIVRRVIKSHPGASVFVTGCAAQSAPQVFTAIEGVRGIVGNAKKNEVVRLAVLSGSDPEKQSSVPVCGCDLSGAEFEKTSISDFKRARAYIKIEDGCESNCSYCIIPSVRGKIRSKPRDEVIIEAEKLIAGGCTELVLTGIETSAYQYDLAALIAEVDRIPGIHRIRLGSLDPSFMRPSFIESYASCVHTMPHFHLSMQSGCNGILSAMRRKYNTENVKQKLEYMRAVMPDIQFSADVICGFPGETERDFEETVKFFKETEFLFLHIFPYSVRPGTEAASMTGQIPRHIARERTAELASVQQKITVNKLQKRINSGKPLDILIETVSSENGITILAGHSPQFIEVKAHMTPDEFEALSTNFSASGTLREQIIRVIPKLLDNQTIIASHMRHKGTNY